VSTSSADIVFADADLDFAAQLAAMQGPITQSGQSCACSSRILVQDSIYDAFIGKFIAAIQAVPIGDPLDPKVTFGPVISQAAMDRILGVIDQAVDQHMGDRILGGKRMGGELAEGYYIEPTVFADVDNRSPLAVEETFGPVVSVTRFRDEDEPVAIANDTVYGLNAFLQTSDLGRAHRVARRLQAGSVWVNHFSDLSPQSPYGGYKQSGSGRAGGLEGLHEFLQVKNIRIAIP
jgi:acyl-CoA reductase-like NAD-dependent aldehyde dehydrogenase